MSTGQKCGACFVWPINRPSGRKGLNRIERKLRKLQEWCEILVGESKENYEHSRERSNRREGSIWKTCCGAIYDMYYNEETNKYIAMYLGGDEEAALDQVNHVKSFIM